MLYLAFGILQNSICAFCARTAIYVPICIVMSSVLQGVWWHNHWHFYYNLCNKVGFAISDIFDLIECSWLAICFIALTSMVVAVYYLNSGDLSNTFYMYSFYGDEWVWLQLKLCPWLVGKLHAMILLVNFSKFLSLIECETCFLIVYGVFVTSFPFLAWSSEHCIELTMCCGGNC